MDPKEFSWTEDQSIIVTNPTDKDYRFLVHSKPYMVKAGQKARMPGYIAWVYVYGLATQICQKNDEWNRWNEEGFRNTYYQKIVDSADSVVQAVETIDEPAETFDDADEKVDKSKPKRGRPAKV